MVLYKLSKQQIGNHLEYKYRLLLSIKDNPLKLFIEVGPAKHVFVCLLRLHYTKSDFRKKKHRLLDRKPIWLSKSAMDW